MREKARTKYDGREPETNTDVLSKKPAEKLEHVNFFADLEDGKVEHNKPNPEHVAEKKAEQEKYEKQIGYLTYLGQDTNEATGKKNWYDEIPLRLRDEDTKIEVQTDKKCFNDPLKDIRRYLKVMGCSSSTSDKPSTTSDKSPSKLKIEKRKRDSDDNGNEERRSRKKHEKSKKKHKSAKRSKESKEDDEKPKIDINKLRAARLLREQSEKARTEALLAKIRGDPPPIVRKQSPKPVVRQQKYNSQFCPEIARQNAERRYQRR